MAIRILLLEDEESIRSFIRINLIREGFEVIEAGTGEEALEKIRIYSHIAIAILDVMLPGIDGFEVCRIMRREIPDMGIIMLTACGQETDKVNGLNCGADDYVVKPFSPVELIARIHALLRRLHNLNNGSNANETDCPPFKIMLGERKLLKNGEEVILTPKEFALIEYFAKNPNRAISRDEILDKVWGWEYAGDLKIVDVNIRRIRQKIEDDPSNPIFIETVWGYGYRWRKGE